MLSSQEEQAERRATLDNDRKLREGSAYIDHYMQEAGGRFSAHAAATVIGSKSEVASAYPAASAAHQIQLPDEPPLGFDNPALEPLPSFSAQATGPTSADAPFASLGDADVGSLSQTGDPTTEGPAPPLASPHAQRGGVGSSPLRRRV
jgi:hypothetical protein